MTAPRSIEVIVRERVRAWLLSHEARDSGYGVLLREFRIDGPEIEQVARELAHSGSRTVEHRDKAPLACLLELERLVFECIGRVRPPQEK